MQTFKEWTEENEPAVKLRRNKEMQENPREYGITEHKRKKDLYKGLGLGGGCWLVKTVEAAEGKSDKDGSMFSGFSKIKEAVIGFPLSGVGI